MSKDLDQLQGTWHIASLEVDGVSTPPGGATIVITGNAFTSAGMGATYDGTVKLDQARQLKTIDLHFTVGHAAGTRNLGIYKLNGDTWTMCLATRGDKRPKAFGTKPDSGHALETLKRGKARNRSRKALPRSNTSPVAGSGPPTSWEGEWTMVSGVFGGAAMGDDMIRWTRRVTHGDVTAVVAGPQTILRARFTLDESKKPATVDYAHLEGSNKGKSQAGIFDLRDDALEVCMAAPGKARPGEFSSTRGDGRSHTIWRHVAKRSSRGDRR